jgi:hypothetical protein
VGEQERLEIKNYIEIDPLTLTYVDGRNEEAVMIEKTAYLNSKMVEEQH